jgi:hypothetical protein
MLNEGKIIETAFLKLGEVGNIYNDNRTDLYKIAQAHLDNIIDQLAFDTTYLFNATTVKLTKHIGQDDELRIRYNVPFNYLNTIKSSHDIYREGEYFYLDIAKTPEPKEVMLAYCKKIELNELPNYLFNLIVYLLCIELSNSFSAYSNKLAYISTLLAQERTKILTQEGLYRGLDY